MTDTNQPQQAKQAVIELEAAVFKERFSQLALPKPEQKEQEQK